MHGGIKLQTSKQNDQTYSSHDSFSMMESEENHV